METPPHISARSVLPPFIFTVPHEASVARLNTSPYCRNTHPSCRATLPRAAVKPRRLLRGAAHSSMLPYTSVVSSVLPHTSSRCRTALSSATSCHTYFHVAAQWLHARPHGVVVSYRVATQDYGCYKRSRRSQWTHIIFDMDAS